MMRKLYWKIFFSFWFTMILIIGILLWLTSEFDSNSQTPLRESIFINSYANAAIATYESGKDSTDLSHWLGHLGKAHKMKIFVINSQGKIFGEHPIPKDVQNLRLAHLKRELPQNLFKQKNVLVSQTIHAADGEQFRVVALLNPLSPVPSLLNPYQDFAIRMFIAISISGILCYFLSRYLTKPLLILQTASKSIASGNFSTRVSNSMGARKDEMAMLAGEFDNMASQLEQLATSKQRLIQDISHELRSPLARLQIALELARTKTNNLAESEFNRIELETSRLNELIREIFSLAQLNKPTLKLALHHVNLLQLLQEIVKDANYEFSKEKPRVILLPSPALTMQLDMKLIHRAVENIVRNALRYSATDKSVEIKMQYHENSQAHVTITISDQGPGVPEDQLERIFYPFHRVDSSRTKETGGYGLGLAIAKQAIQLHGGKLKAYNREIGGLTIEINLSVLNPKLHVENLN